MFLSVFLRVIFFVFLLHLLFFLSSNPITNQTNLIAIAGNPSYIA